MPHDSADPETPADASVSRRSGRRTNEIVLTQPREAAPLPAAPGAATHAIPDALEPRGRGITMAVYWMMVLLLPVVAYLTMIVPAVARWRATVEEEDRVAVKQAALDEEIARKQSELMALQSDPFANEVLRRKYGIPWSDCLPPSPAAVENPQR